MAHELPNDLRLIRKYQESAQTLYNDSPLPSLPPLPNQNQNFANARKKLLKNRKETPPAVRFPTRKPELVANIPRLAVAPNIIINC